MTRRYPLDFWLGNGVLVVFFYGTWLLSWWIPAVNDATSGFGWVTYSFICFCGASFIALSTAGKKFVVLKSLGFASVFMVLLFCLICVSIPFLPID